MMLIVFWPKTLAELLDANLLNDQPPGSVWSIKQDERSVKRQVLAEFWPTLAELQMRSVSIEQTHAPVASEAQNFQPFNKFIF